MKAAELRLPPGPVDLTAIDSGTTAGFDGGKKAGKGALLALGDGLSDLQERLFAEGVADVGHGRALLLVLQGMDTSGKGGVLKHTVGLVDPQGLRITSFKKPTKEELAHDFLWRIRKALPDKGHIGVFDRSHYEDVLIGRVRELAPKKEIERRYDAINAFEAEAVGAGITMVKCMLHISAATQKERLLARLANPAKYWKFNPADVDERALWPAYREAYEIALERTNTEVAPWYVIPSDHKWYRNLAICHLLHATLSHMAPQWPAADFDVDAQVERLVDEAPRPVIPTVGVTRYVTPLREGGSLPGIVEADDLGTYVCKFRGAGQGVRVLVAEVVVAELATRIGLRTPRVVGLQLDPEIARYEADEEVQDLLNASPGLNLGTDFLPGSFGYDGEAAMARLADSADPARVLWLDAFTANVDRSWRNPNLLLWHGELYVIDHGACLYFHHAWSGGITDPARFAAQPWAFDDHVFRDRVPELSAVDAELRGLLGEEAFADAVAQVPDEWLEPVPGAEDPEAVRAAYVAFLTARLATRQWLPGAA